MDTLRSLTRAKRTALKDLHRLLRRLQRLSLSRRPTLQEGLDRLREIRKAVYEDLNQVQHECLIIEAAEWLTVNQHTPTGAHWYWNPRQTGGLSEPDLSAQRRGVQLIAAEATASEKPAGVIDSRMAETLKKLAAMRGRKFYFVRTPAMKKRAETKVRRAGWPIEVVLVDSPRAL